MKRFFLLVIIGVLLSPYVEAYESCAPACPTGFSQNGTSTCSGLYCNTSCVTQQCTGTWTQVHANMKGWSGQFGRKEDQTSSYAPTDHSLCYKFSYIGPPADNLNITCVGVNPPTGFADCDCEMIGGFWEGTGSTSSTSNPWFEGMSGYIGNVGDSRYDYLLKIVRAHTEYDAGASATYRDDAGGQGSIYCTNGTYACSLLGGSNTCDTDCYSRTTEGRAVQGYYEDTYNSQNNNQEQQDANLYNDVSCGNSNVVAGGNRYQSFEFQVLSSPTDNFVKDVGCERPHSPPNVTNVSVIPTNPNAGNDLQCVYDYYDEQSYVEQDSLIEWWKNGANQNINTSTLGKGNLTVGDIWNCKVAPSNALLVGSQTSSQNNVTITTTVLNPQLNINGTNIWNETGYFGEEVHLTDLANKLQNALSTCISDSQGYCDIVLELNSSSTGVINITDLEIFYTVPPSIINQSTPQNNSVFINNRFNITLNVTVSSANSNNLTVQIFGGNDTPVNREWLLYYNDSVPNGSTIIYNWTASMVRSDAKGLVGLWHMDGRSEYGENNTHLYDFSGSSNNGTANGSVPIFPSKFGKGYSFDGNDDYIFVGNDSSLDLTTNFSISFWFYLRSAAFSTFLSKEDAVGSEDWILRYQTFPLNAIVFKKGGSGQLVPWFTSISLNTWHHLVFTTENGYNHTLYLDGINYGIVTQYSPIPQGDPVVFGAEKTSSINNEMDGVLDEIAVWNRTLSEGEARDLYRLGEGTYYWYAEVDDLFSTTQSSTLQFSVIKDTLLANITNLSVIYANTTERVIRFDIINTKNTTILEEVDWQLNTSQSLIDAQYITDIPVSKDMIVYVYYNFTTPGAYNISATAFNYDARKTASMLITV